MRFALIAIAGSIAIAHAVRGFKHPETDGTAAADRDLLGRHLLTNPGDACDNKAKVMQCGGLNGLKCSDMHKCVYEKCHSKSGTKRGALCMPNRNVIKDLEEGVNRDPNDNPFFLACNMPDSNEYCGGIDTANADAAGKNCVCGGSGKQAKNGKCQKCEDCAQGLKCVIDGLKKGATDGLPHGHCMGEATQTHGDTCGWDSHCADGFSCLRKTLKCEEKPLPLYVADACDSSKSTFAEGCEGAGDGACQSGQ